VRLDGGEIESGGFDRLAGPVRVDLHLAFRQALAGHQWDRPAPAFQGHEVQRALREDEIEPRTSRNLGQEVQIRLLPLQEPGPGRRVLACHHLDARGASDLPRDSSAGHLRMRSHGLMLAQPMERIVAPHAQFTQAWTGP
jgi:hypothetical protein